jgi:hypothetical protein
MRGAEAVLCSIGMVRATSWIECSSVGSRDPTGPALDVGEARSDVLESSPGCFIQRLV